LETVEENLDFGNGKARLPRVPNDRQVQLDVSSEPPLAAYTGRRMADIGEVYGAVSV